MDSPARPDRRRRAGRRAKALVAVLLTGLIGGGCAAVDAPPTAGTVRVFAASSLTEVLRAVAAAFEETRPGTAVELNFGGSSALVTQLAQGADADVLVTADDRTYERAVAAGVVGPGSVVAVNRLAIVVERKNPEQVTGIGDLARDDLIVVTCVAAAPCGRYADAAFAAAGVTVVPRSREANVKAVVAKVALGEADAGVAYETDARAAAVDTVPLAGADHPGLAVRYRAGIASGAGGDQDALAFVAFLRSGAGSSVLERHGFRVPGDAR